MRFDIVDLRLFVAVASCGNLTRAAEGFPIAVAAAIAPLGEAMVRAQQERELREARVQEREGAEATP